MDTPKSLKRAKIRESMQFSATIVLGAMSVYMIGEGWSTTAEYLVDRFAEPENRWWVHALYSTILTFTMLILLFTWGYYTEKKWIVGG